MALTDVCVGSRCRRVSGTQQTMSGHGQSVEFDPQLTIQIQVSITAKKCTVEPTPRPRQRSWRPTLVW
jgi:hypothetical protein